MRIDAAVPEPVRQGVAQKKGRADEGVESFLGPLAQVLVDLAKQAMPQPRTSATPPEAGGSGPGTGKAPSARQLRAFALALAEMDVAPGKARVPAPAATPRGQETLPFERPAVLEHAAVTAEARDEGARAVPDRPVPAVRPTSDSAVAEAAPLVSLEATAEPEAAQSAPTAQQTASPAAEAALVGLYTSASTGSPPDLGAEARHVASLHQQAAPRGAEAEGLPAIHEAAVLKTVSASGEAARVEVQHPELGAIQLDLKLERGSMDLHAVTTSASSAIALRASESALRTSVALAGVELRGMRVDVAGDPEKSVEVRKKRRGDKRPLDTEA